MEEQPKDQPNSELNNTEPKEEIHEKRIIFNGECEHEWIQEKDDPEGKGVAHCRHCPMGRYFNKNEWNVKNGRIEKISKVV